MQTFPFLVNPDRIFGTAFDYNIQGNSVIAVNGDKKVDLENTQLYQKASRPSLT